MRMRHRTSSLFITCLWLNKSVVLTSWINTVPKCTMTMKRMIHPPVSTRVCILEHYIINLACFVKITGCESHWISSQQNNTTRNCICWGGIFTFNGHLIEKKVQDVQERWKLLDHLDATCNVLLFDFFVNTFQYLLKINDEWLTNTSGL